MQAQEIAVPLMSQFLLYFDLGLNHILDTKGYDHILFILALCSVYLLRDWKKVLILVTAFTIGHSVTLALSALKIVMVDTSWIEFLIPVTIFITAFINLFRKHFTFQTKYIQLNYFFALFFGLVHGFGFSSYLKGLLGREVDILRQLLGFNLGLELGQIIVVIIFLMISFIFVRLFNVSRRDWNLIISSGIIGIAITLMIENKFW